MRAFLWRTRLICPSWWVFFVGKGLCLSPAFRLAGICGREKLSRCRLTLRWRSLLDLYGSSASTAGSNDRRVMRVMAAYEGHLQVV